MLDIVHDCYPGPKSPSPVCSSRKSTKIQPDFSDRKILYHDSGRRVILGGKGLSAKAWDKRPIHYASTTFTRYSINDQFRTCHLTRLQCVCRSSITRCATHRSWEVESPKASYSYYPCSGPGFLGQASPHSLFLSAFCLSWGTGKKMTFRWGLRFGVWYFARLPV